MNDELRKKIIAYNKAKKHDEEKAKDLEDLLSKLYAIYELLKPIIPDEVKAVFKKYGYAKEKN